VVNVGGGDAHFHGRAAGETVQRRVAVGHFRRKVVGCCAAASIFVLKAPSATLGRANRASNRQPECYGRQIGSRIVRRSATDSKSSVESPAGVLRTANRVSNRQPECYGRQIEPRITCRNATDGKSS